MNTKQQKRTTSHGRKAIIAFVAVASMAVGGLAVPSQADAGPRTGSDRIDLSGCDSPATVLENCVDNTTTQSAVAGGYVPASSLKAVVDLGGPRTGSDRIDLSGCDSPATVLENCVD